MSPIFLFLHSQAFCAEALPLYIKLVSVCPVPSERGGVGRDFAATLKADLYLKHAKCQSFLFHPLPTSQYQSWMPEFYPQKYIFGVPLEIFFLGEVRLSFSAGTTLKQGARLA
ncbi:hypothetical protein CDAR_386481 [Caerostris darwini]|uniref:Uncharacterized protein n=1 Tax=Caerostris darwini TaxID=1538125 RepID=A0AAV4QEG6_9ARAC|nr:hypothetical protein CDAR_386481 [Caerostris darwini]